MSDGTSMLFARRLPRQTSEQIAAVNMTSTYAYPTTSTNYLPVQYARTPYRQNARVREYPPGLQEQRQAEYEAQVEAQQQEAAAAEAARRRRTRIIVWTIVIILVVLIVIGVIVYFLFFRGGSGGGGSSNLPTGSSC